MNKLNYPIAIVLLLSLSLILGLLIFFPKYRDLSGLSGKIKINEEKIKLQEEYFSNLNSLSEELKKYETELSKVNSILPDDPSLPSLLNFIEKASSQSGLVLKSISPASSVSFPQIEGAKETKVSLTVSGSYSDFKNFISVLEKSARLIETENISFFSPSGEGTADFNLRIKVYSY